MSLVLPVQKVLSSSGRAERLRLMGKYIGHRLVARPELDNTFWTDSTEILSSQIPQSRSQRKVTQSNKFHTGVFALVNPALQFLLG